MVFQCHKKANNRAALLQRIAAYIDRNYAEVCEKAVFQTLREDHRTQLLPRRNARDNALGGTVCENAMPCPTMAASLEDILKQADAGFTETLLKHIDRTGKKDSEIYKKANLSKQHFCKIRNNPNYKPTKPTAIALALALELNLEDTKDLIGRAGYALTNSSKFDLIIRYFIEQKHYDIVEINFALYEFDQPLLGC